MSIFVVIGATGEAESILAAFSDLEKTTSFITSIKTLKIYDTLIAIEMEIDDPDVLKSHKDLDIEPNYSNNIIQLFPDNKIPVKLVD